MHFDSSGSPTLGHIAAVSAKPLDETGYTGDLSQSRHYGRSLAAKHAKQHSS